MLLRSRYVSDYGERTHGLHRGRWARTVARVSSNESLSGVHGQYHPDRDAVSRNEVCRLSVDESDGDSYTTPPPSTRTLSSACPPAPKKQRTTKDVDMSVLTQEPDQSNWSEEETTTTTVEEETVTTVEEKTTISTVTGVPGHVWNTVTKVWEPKVLESNPRAYILNSKLTKCARKHCTNLRMGFGSSRFCVQCRPKCVKCKVRWQVKGSFKCKVCRKIDPRTVSSESESESESD